jgi:glucan phosphoethanolaminetransferase (alkaline phosphatase superfamily)
MTTTMFLILLSGFSVIASLITEAIKTVANDKANLSYNLIAIIVALVVGSGGCAIYYQLNGILFTTNNVIYMILMGFASGLTATIGYDKVKQTILQLTGKEEITE